MKNRYLILGGDMRNVKLAELLSEDENKVITYGLEKANEIQDNNKIENINNLAKAIELADIIVAPTPFSSNGQNINTPLSDEKIMINQLIKSNKSKIFIAGSLKEEIKKQLEEKYLKVIDIMSIEELTILNTIATAEGTIEVAIKNTDRILQGLKVLILGFGRVAKIVANKFSMLSTKVTCVARKTSDLAWIQAYGYKAINFKDMIYELNEYDIIINTVPQCVLNERELKHTKSDVVLIDLASIPGGIDGETANRMGLKFIWALALPGKVAPKSSAEFIKQTIYNIVMEENVKKTR